MKHHHESYVYIMTNAANTALYTGVTNNLERRAAEHRDGNGSAFTKKYRTTKLVYYETFNAVTDAIAFEKKVKSRSRAKKIALIDEMNPEWKDLAAEHG